MLRLIMRYRAGFVRAIPSGGSYIAGDGVVPKAGDTLITSVSRGNVPAERLGLLPIELEVKGPFGPWDSFWHWRLS